MLADPAADDSRGGSILVRVAAFLLVGMLAYVLSIGPVSLFTRSLPQGQVAMLRRVYTPLIWLAQETAYGRPIIVYALWWESLGRDQ